MTGKPYKWSVEAMNGLQNSTKILETVWMVYKSYG